MAKQKIGVIHPGMMGICVAATVQNSGHEVYWVAEGRSPQSRQRAEKFNLSDAGTLPALCESCSVIISVCPPHAAEEVAEQVLAHSFQGVYLDVNAKAWRFAGEMAEIAATFREAGLPGEFHAAAEMIYQRLAGFKDAPETPALEAVLEKLAQQAEK